MRGVWAPIDERRIALGHHRFAGLHVTGFVEAATGATVSNISEAISTPPFVRGERSSPAELSAPLWHRGFRWNRLPLFDL
jgi:hypothetical protein